MVCILKAFSDPSLWELFCQFLRSYWEHPVYTNWKTVCYPQYGKVFKTIFFA